MKIARYTLIHILCLGYDDEIFSKCRKIPITLRHNADSDGLLLNQQEARIEYDTYQDLVEDVDKLLSDESYLKEREALLEGTVITEQRFVNNVRGVIEKHQTDYEHEVIEIDTSEFQKNFIYVLIWKNKNTKV